MRAPNFVRATGEREIHDGALPFADGDRRLPRIAERTGYGERGANRREIGRDQPLQLGHELVRPLGRRIQREHFDGNQTLACRIVGAEDRTQRARANLMQDSERSEGVRGDIASSVSVQRRTPQEGAFIVTRNGRNRARPIGVLVLLHQSNSASACLTVRATL